MKNRKKIRIADPIKKPYETLLTKFSTDNACLDAIFGARAAKETTGCYCCGAEIEKFYRKMNGRKGYQCAQCLFQVYPMAGTVLNHLHIIPKDFFRITIEKIINNSGITANKIAYQYSYSNDTAFKILHRVRLWMALTCIKKFEGSRFEIDETGINTGTKGLGRKKRKSRGFGSDSITPCFSIMDREGQVRSFIVPNREGDTLLPIITDMVGANAIIYTDEYGGYKKLKSLGYDHRTVNHSQKEWKNGDASTNRIEGYFGLVKPNLKGTYRQIGEKYSPLYMAEHDFRYNNRNLPLDQRFQKLLDCLPPLFEHIRARETENSDNKQSA